MAKQDPEASFGATIESACALTCPDGASGEERELLPQVHAKKSDEADETADPCVAAIVAFPQVHPYLPILIEAPNAGAQNQDCVGALQASGDAGIRFPQGAFAPLASSEGPGFAARATGEEPAPCDTGGDPTAIEGAAEPPKSGLEAVGADQPANESARLLSEAVGADPRVKESARLFSGAVEADPRAKESAKLLSDVRAGLDAKAPPEGPKAIVENPQSKASTGLASGIREGFDAKVAASIGGSLDARSVVPSESSRNEVRRADAPPASPMAQAPRDEASSATAWNPRVMETPSAQTQTVGDQPEKAAARSMDDPTRTEDISAPTAALAPSQPDGEAQGAERAQTAPRTDAPRATPEPGPSAQLARSAVGALARGESQFHLRLRPEGIGEVAVTIRARERELSLHIRASSGETRELILSQIDDLRGGLATGDYRLGELSVEVNASGHEGAAFSTFAQGEGNREAPRQPLKQSQVAAAEVPDRVIQTRKGAILYRI